MKIIQPYDIDAMIAHYAQYAEQIRTANEFCNQHRQKFLDEHNKKMHLVFTYPDFRDKFNKHSLRAIEYAKTVPQGALNINVQIPRGIYAIGTNLVPFPANMFPAGSLHFAQQCWHVLADNPTNIHHINDDYYELSDLISTHNNIVYFNAKKLEYAAYGLSRFSPRIVASDSDKYFSAGTTIADAHNQLFRDFYNKNREKIK